MNLKTILSLTALSAATVACAAVTTDNTLCRIEVNSTEAQTIIAVPLVEVGTGDAIPVTDIVLTTNLTNGDTILHKNGDSWDAWVVDNGAWKPLAITEGMSTKWTKGAADVTLDCGDAIWVNRQSTSKPFYIYGQVPASMTKPEIPTASGVMKLMGNTQLKDAKIAEIISGSPKAGDKVVWANSANALKTTELQYNGTTWGMYVATPTTVGSRTVLINVWKTDIPVPAGQGFWYVAK